MSVIEALFWVSVTLLGGWDIIFGRWGWAGLYGALFWVGWGGWGIILGGWVWVRKYLGWVGVGGCGWVWVGVGAMFDNAGSKSSENGIIVFKD